jgi:hypothetical protein
MVKKLLYRILKKDIINKLRKKRGEQFVDDVMNLLGMPTNFLIDGFPDNGSWWKNKET